MTFEDIEVRLRRHGFLVGPLTESDKRCIQALLDDLPPTKCEGCSEAATLCETCALDRANA